MSSELRRRSEFQDNGVGDMYIRPAAPTSDTQFDRSAPTVMDGAATNNNDGSAGLYGRSQISGDSLAQRQRVPVPPQSDAAYMINSTGEAIGGLLQSVSREEPEPEFGREMDFEPQPPANHFQATFGL